MEVSVLENLRPLRHAPLDDRPHLLDVRRERVQKRGAARHEPERRVDMVGWWVSVTVLASTVLTGCVIRYH